MEKNMATLYYQGHGSFRLTTDAGKVLYIDPFAGDGYDVPADLILVTHQHPDHNRIDLPKRAADCVIYQNTDALKDGEYQETDIADVHIEAVPAYNKNHRRDACVGYLLSVDGVTLYFAGDTSMTEEMERLALRQIDYAFLPADGVFNMDIPEAVKCAEKIRAKHTVPVHIAPGKLFDPQRAESFAVDGRLILLPGTETVLRG